MTKGSDLVMVLGRKISLWKSTNITRRKHLKVYSSENVKGTFYRGRDINIVLFVVTLSYIGMESLKKVITVVLSNIKFRFKFFPNFFAFSLGEVKYELENYEWNMSRKHVTFPIHKINYEHEHPFWIVYIWMDKESQFLLKMNLISLFLDGLWEWREY